MNFLKNYVEYGKSITDSPIDFHEYIGLATAGIAIGRSRYFCFGETELFPNFYLTILAPSSFYHKSTCLHISKKMMIYVNPLKVMASDFSKEKMVENLNTHGTGIIYYDEFRTLMGMLELSWHVNTKPFLTELYDCYPIPVERQGKSFTVENPMVSIISGTTVDWFLNTIKSHDIYGGFLARFIFIHSTKKIRDDALPQKADQALREKVKYNLQTLNDLQPAEMIMSPEAEREYRAWYKKFCVSVDSINANVKPLFARLNIVCIKLAIVIQTCANQQTEITPESMREAIHYTDHIQSNTLALCREEISFSKAEATEKKILRLLKEKGKLSQANILRYANLSAWDFKTTIQTLLEKEHLTQTFEKSEGSQKPSRFFELKTENKS